MRSGIAFAAVANPEASPSIAATRDRDALLRRREAVKKLMCRKVWLGNLDSNQD